MKRDILLCIIAIMAGLSHTVFADTIVVDTVLQTNTLWSKAESPYVLIHNLSVSSGATLTIEPGVTVKIGTAAVITVDGKIIAQGTDDLPIVFTSNQESSYINKSSDWGKILVRSGGSVFSYATLNHALTGTELLNAQVSFDHMIFSGDDVGIKSTTSQYAITESQFSNIGTDALSVIGGTATIASTTVTTMNRALNITTGANATVSASTFVGSTGTAVTVVSGGNLTFDHVTVDGSGAANMVSVSGAIGNVLSKITINDSILQNGLFHGVSVSNFAVGIINRTSLRNFNNNAIQQLNSASIEIHDSTISKSNVGIALVTGTGTNNQVTITGSVISGNSMGAKVSTGLLIATNNWWGDASGPYHSTLNPDGKGDVVSGNILFSPWLISNPLEPCCSSVAFLPGLEASRLYTQQTFENQLWEPNRNDDVRKLFLNDQGESIDQNIYTRDIIDQVNIIPFIGPTIYKNFMTMLDGLVTNKNIHAWQALPYDWRLDIRAIAINMVSQIENLARDSLTGKVTLIAHSNGGLVAKVMMQELEKRGEADLIDRVILVAVPQLGTPSAIAALLHGYDQRLGLGFILDGGVARDFGLNMPGAYGLLPSKKYFSVITDPVITFDSVLPAIGDYGSLNDYLSGKDGRAEPPSNDLSLPYVLNPTLLARAQDLHDSIDDWVPPAGISLIQIAGWGIDTIKDMSYTSTAATSSFAFEPDFTLEGDKTVVYPSAISSSASSTQTYYLNIRDYNTDLSFLEHNRQHADILEIQPLEDLLKSIILNTISPTHLPADITLDKPDASKEKDRIHIAVKSADIDMYDNAGNHTGLVQNPINGSDLKLYEENIPNSYYLEMGTTGKYAGLSPNGGSIVIHGSNLPGTFTVKTSTVSGDVEVASTTFADIPETPELEADLIISTTTATSSPLLLVDVNGDGVKDISIMPIDGSDPVLFLQIFKQTIPTLGFSDAVTLDLTSKIDAVLVSLTKIVTSVKTLTTQFQSDWKTGKTVQEQQDALINMIDAMVTSAS